MAIGSSDGTAVVCDTATGSRCFKIRTNSSGAQLQDLAFSPDGLLLVTASEDTTARVWATTSGRRLQTLTHDGVVYDLAFSPDGRLLATASFDGTARVWQADTGREVLTLTHVREVYGIAFSPDGRLLATGCRDKNARVWDVTSGRQVVTVKPAMPCSVSLSAQPDCLPPPARIGRCGCGTALPAGRFTHCRTRAS